MSARIHFHSDASFFAGCENMLVNLFNDNNFTGSYEISFSYRYSKEYEQGFRQRVTNQVKTYPLAIADAGWLNVGLMKLVAQFLKYIYIVYNTVLLYKLFRTLKIDLLHINNGGYPGAYSCMSAVFAAKLAGIKRIVYVVNNVAFSYRRPGRWFDYFLDKIVKRSVSVFVTGSVYAGQELQEGPWIASR